MNRYYLWLMATALLLLVTAQPTSAAPAATITVTANSADVLDANGGDCSTMTAAHLPGANNETSLREAICVANNTAGADIIDVPAGAYTLAIAGQNEDGNATGDLDITDDLTISGAGAATTIIQAGTDATNGIDRVFHIFQPGSYVSLALNDLTIRNGRAPDNTPGGGIHGSSHILILTDSIVSNNAAGNGSSGGNGGGIYLEEDGDLTMSNSQVLDNVAGDGATSRGGSGGGIYLSKATATISGGSVINGNRTGDGGPNSYGGSGGGIYSSSRPLSVTDSFVRDNSTGSGGPGGYGGNGAGIYASNNTLTIDRNEISGNAASASGGGLYVEMYAFYPAVTLSDNVVSNNSAGIDGSGGGIHVSAGTGGPGGSLTLLDHQITGNTAVRNGGGIYVSSQLDTVTFTRLTVTGNSSAVGGGAAIIQAHLVSVTDSQFVDNNAFGTNCPQCQVPPDTYNKGGGLWVQGDSGDATDLVDVTGSTFTGNHAGEWGGGIATEDTMVSIELTSVSNNNSRRDGGGMAIIWSEDVKILDSTIDGNTASSGGGIYVADSNFGDPVTITGSTISNNTSDGLASETRVGGSDPDYLGSGGGVFIETGQMDVTNSTISGNNTASNGGGIFMDFPDGNISYTTMANNSAGNQGGGIYAISPSVTLQTTIVADNTAPTAGPDCYDQGGLSNPFSGGSYNLISSLSPASGFGSCANAFNDPTDIVDQDPQLGPLQDNGGPTLTHALAPSSPAMSQVPQSSNGCGTDVVDDQRALSRPGAYMPADRCEVGAWEAQAEDILYDFADAPDTGSGTGQDNYETLATSGGPSHLIVAGLHLGSVAPDGDDGSLQNGGATADDDDNVDDEEGVSALPTITDRSQSVALTVDYTNASGSPATLACWIDFNRDGLFASSERAAATVTSDGGNNPRSETLTFSGFGTPVLGDSYIRCRIATVAGEVADAVGSANSGEVEDVQVAISAAPKDYGDAPDSPYATTASNGGPSHVIVAGLHLGSVAPDADDGTLQNAAALADDDNNTDDEDGISTLPTITDKSQSVALTVDYTNASGSPAILACWIDFNRDGLFASSERAAATVSSDGNNPRSETLTFSGFGTPVLGDSYIRCRIASAAGEVANPTGPANSGEVEDVQVTIIAAPKDWGDAPDSPYATTASNGGPSHVIVAGLHLGSVAPDADDGTLQNAAALADDDNNTDDEDGLSTLPTITDKSQSVALTVDYTNASGSPATLACWIDFNRDGLFASSERAEATVSSDGGNNPRSETLTFSGFGTPVLGDSYIRCRIATVAGEVADAVGPANSGEVEDVQVTIIAAPMDYGDAPDGGGSTGEGSYTTTSGNNGPSHLVVAGLHLGSVAPDGDDGSLENATADNDDNTGVDDEDGIKPINMPTITTDTSGLILKVDATNNTNADATLACWIDFNRDGDFWDQGEASSPNVSVPAGSGTAEYTLTFSNVVKPVEGDSIIRCRIAHNGGELTSPNGAATSGEVEDTLVKITKALGLELNSFAAERDGDVVNFRWETGTETGNAGFNLFVETGNGLAPINQELIPSSVIDAMTPTAYSYSATVAGEVFYIDLVGVEGGSERYGPYMLSLSGGLPDGVEMTPAVWLPIVVR